MEYPLGKRGEFPVAFGHHPWSRAESVLQIPGVDRDRRGIVCTWDAAPYVAYALGIPAPIPPIECNVDMRAVVESFPGIARVRKLKADWESRQLGLRPYQNTGAAFLAYRSWAMLTDVRRLGKTLQAITAAELVAAQGVLVICPADIKRGWAREIALRLGQSALLLFGRAGTHARRYCVACLGSGSVGSARCEFCRGRGYAKIGPELIDASLEGARWVIVNYDLLIPQISGDAAGRIITRDDLPGWAPRLAQFEWDVAIVDECHRVRGWAAKGEGDESSSKRESCRDLLRPVPVVWGLTGTPLCGFTRDLWGQVDLISGGLWSRNDLPFKYHAYFCDGHKGDYGWRCDGTSERAKIELPARMKIFSLGRPRSVAIPYMPAKTRVVRHIECDEAQQIPRGTDRMSRVSKMMKATLRAKIGPIVDEVIEELAQGGACVVFTQRKESATEIAKAIDRAMQSTKQRRRMAATNAKLMSVVGEDPDARSAAMERFVAHVSGSNAACYVATIASTQVGSLRGAHTVHYAEVEHSPDQMLQSEDRGYEPGITHGLTIIYWAVEKSYDEHAIKKLVPKIELLDKLAQESNQVEAAEMAAALRGPRAAAATLDEIFDSMTANLPDEIGEGSDAWSQ